mgnify:CR=1 FL=1
MKVTNLNDLEIIHKIKRELIRKRQEIEAMKNMEENNEALRAYAELLTTLEIGTFESPTSTKQPFPYKETM